MNTDSQKKRHTFIIPDIHADERLDQALARLMPEYSRTQIKDWLDSGSILINGLAAKGKTRIKGGETVTAEIPVITRPHWEAQPIPLNIVHEDDALILVNKPAGLVVHPGAGNQDRTLMNALLHHDPALQALPRAGILHRLDKDTSGLLIIAKTAAALKHLSLQLKKRSLLREYQAIVYGTMISGGSVDAPIDRHPLQRKRMAVIDTGKSAVTHYRIAEKFRAHTRLKIRLETGRTHQIRVHMAYIRHPIVGDAVYGGRIQLAKGLSEQLITALRQFKRQALHAFALGLTHPDTEEFMRWEIDLPEDMNHLIQVLREDLNRNAP
ncbi:Ribosomal large subunit pseudouridine synthase D [Aquicella siphonis]|uniref:Pseudouridine synthase n=1 Tax=Aquicella siphonis TaxID=254247 RepID=A0A5E4PII2_9COXI|nr:23S rRNA pseudouridine(1911/1915/1917) synthase RluD [Aquicella siphonis]VVC76106.1 Ribosomal large subunit pseudouridine synthase D [Aquicella siphonis]